MVDSGKIDENDNSHHCFLGGYPQYNAVAL